MARSEGDSPLRVLLVTPDYPPAAGGIQLLLSRVAENARGVDFRVLTLGRPDAAEHDAGSRIDVRRVSSAGSDPRLRTVRLNLRSLREAAAFRPDVVLSGHVVASLGALALRRALGVPFVQYVHADEFRVRAALCTAAVRHADATIAVSGYTREMALAAGAEPERVHVIPPGVDLPPPPAEGRRRSASMLTVASLLFRYKGHDTMVRALPLVRARVEGASWAVIGDGPFRAAVERSVAAYGLEGSVELLGKVSDEERDRRLAGAGVFCMPSRLPAAGIGGEGFGIAYLEAGAHGVPSVAGNVAGARDAVIDGETGFLVDPTDHLAVADAAAEILSDPRRAEEMGSRARAHAESHAWPLIAGRVSSLLREVVGRGPS